MNRDRRLPSSRIGGRNDRAYTSHENRWHSVNDSHLSDQNDRCSPIAEYDGSLSRDFEYQNNYTRYYNDRQPPIQSCRNQNDVRNYDNDWHSRHHENSSYYDDRRVSYSPRNNERRDEIRSYSDSTDSDYGNGWDNQTRQNSSEHSYDEDFVNRKSVQTSPPRWSIDGEPASFTEYQRFLVNSQRQFEGRKSRNYFFDCDKEQEFEKLMNKMKIGQRDREKLAEEMGFDDVPPPPPPRRGGFRRYHR
ncbi:unnamed protein product [Caenorhabditis brenneri]